MIKKDESRPIRAKLQFKGNNNAEYWSCDNREQLGNAIVEDYQATGRELISVSVRKEDSHE